jgi:hypothetical protein
LLFAVYGIFATLYAVYTESKRKDKVWSFVGFLFFLAITLMSVEPVWEMWEKIFAM